jgi:hypothetical protein
VALRVRGAYADFRLQVAGLPEPQLDGRAVRTHLLRVGTLIAAFLCDAFPVLRVEDRAQLRQLQARVRQWLRAPDPAPKDGVRVWRDFVAYVDLLGQVNSREGLVEHDRAVVRRLVDPATHTEPDEARRLVQCLYGLDAQIDGELRRDAPRLIERVWPRLLCLAAGFGVAEVVG